LSPLIIILPSLVLRKNSICPDSSLIEPTSGGYKTFKIAPKPGGGITWAKAAHICPYGEIKCEWKIVNDEFKLQICVPFGTSASVVMPNGNEYEVTNGKYCFTEVWDEA